MKHPQRTPLHPLGYYTSIAAETLPAKIQEQIHVDVEYDDEDKRVLEVSYDIQVSFDEEDANLLTLSVNALCDHVYGEENQRVGGIRAVLIDNKCEGDALNALDMYDSIGTAIFRSCAATHALRSAPKVLYIQSVLIQEPWRGHRLSLHALGALFRFIRNTVSERTTVCLAASPTDANRFEDWVRTLYAFGFEIVDTEKWRDVMYTYMALSMTPGMRLIRSGAAVHLIRRDERSR